MGFFLEELNPEIRERMCEPFSPTNIMRAMTLAHIIEREITGRAELNGEQGLKEWRAKAIQDLKTTLKGGRPPSYPALSRSFLGAALTHNIPQLRRNTSGSSNTIIQAEGRDDRSGKALWPHMRAKYQQPHKGADPCPTKTTLTKEKNECMSIMINLTTCAPTWK